MIPDPSIITSQNFSGCSKSVGHSPKFELFATLGGLSQTFELFSKRLGPYRAASSLNVQDQTAKRLGNWNVWTQTAERLKVFQNADPTLNGGVQTAKHLKFCSTFGSRRPSVKICFQNCEPTYQNVLKLSKRLGHMGRLSNVLSVNNYVPSLQTFKVFWTLLDQTIKLLEVLLKTRVQSGKSLKVCFDVCIRRAKLLQTCSNVCARLPRPSSNITKCLLSVARWAQTFATTFKRLASWDKTLKALSNVWRSNPNVGKHFWTFGGSGPNFRQQTLESVARSGPNIWKSDERLGTRAQAENKNC